QAKLKDSRTYWSSTNAARSALIRYSGKHEGAIDILAASMRLTVNPGDCSILGIYDGQANLLEKPVPLVIFRVGGLEESGRYLGRSFVKPRALKMPDGGTETALCFGAHGMTMIFRTAPDLNAVSVKCCYGNLPCNGTLEFPWMKYLSPGEEVSSDRALDVSLKMKIPRPARTWSFVSGTKTILISEPEGSFRAQATTAGILWNIREAAEVECLINLR
ncbi:MAG: hypothetical protein WC637_17735, partial [Victivallales bacterium]